MAASAVDRIGSDAVIALSGAAEDSPLACLVRALAGAPPLMNVETSSPEQKPPLVCLMTSLRRRARGGAGVAGVGAELRSGLRGQGPDCAATVGCCCARTPRSRLSKGRVVIYPSSYPSALEPARPCAAVRRREVPDELNFFIFLVSYRPLDNLASTFSSKPEAPPLPRPQACAARHIPLYHREIITRHPRAAAAL